MSHLPCQVLFSTAGQGHADCEGKMSQRPEAGRGQTREWPGRLGGPRILLGTGVDMGPEACAPHWSATTASRDILQAERDFPTFFWSAQFNTQASEVNMDGRQGQPLGLAGAGGPTRALTGGRSLAWVRQSCRRREEGREGDILSLRPTPCQSPPLSGLNSRADMAALSPEGFLLGAQGPLVNTLLSAPTIGVEQGAHALGLHQA